MKIIYKFALRAVLVVGIVGGAVFGVKPAQASTLLFTLSGTDNITWVLDSSRTPDDVDLGNSFDFAGVGPSNYLTFFSTGQLGGLTASTQPGGAGSSVFNLVGPQIYSGLESSPVFTPGIYLGLTGLGNPGIEDTLTISETPLPSTWLMLLSGFAGLGLFAYRGTKRRAAAFAVG